MKIQAWNPPQKKRMGDWIQKADDLFQTCAPVKIQIAMMKTAKKTPSASFNISCQYSLYHFAMLLSLCLGAEWTSYRVIGGAFQASNQRIL